MAKKPNERRPKRCNHHIKSVKELTISDLPEGVMYIVSECLHKSCGQLSIRKVEPTINHE